MSEEDAKKKTDMEERKAVMKLPTQEHLAWALTTSASICFAVGLLIVLQGMNAVDWVQQTAMLVAAVVVFCFGGYLQHAYSRWFIRQVK
jgi:hypothetical protein